MNEEEVNALRQKVADRHADTPLPEDRYYMGVAGQSIQGDALRAFKYLMVGAFILVLVRAVSLDFLYTNPVTARYAPYIPTGFLVTGMTWFYAVVVNLKDKLYYLCVTTGVVIADVVQPYLFIDQPEFWQWIYGSPYVDHIMNTRGRLYGLVE